MPSMRYKKVYVALPMDPSMVAAIRLVKELGIGEGEFRVDYALGLSTLWVVPERAAQALDRLLAAGLLNQDDAWTYFISAPVDLH